MSLKKLFLSVFILFSILLICMGVLIVSMLQNQQDLNNAQQTRYLSYLVANEFSLSSQDLTRLARTYATTGDPRYEAMYHDIIAIRNGEKPGPDGKTISLTQKMKDLGFSPEEFALLDKALAESNDLVSVEVKAMNAVKGLFDDGTGNYVKGTGPDLVLARDLMFSRQYHDYLTKIDKPVKEFFSHLDHRTKIFCDQLEDKAKFYINMAFLILVIFFISIAFVGWVVYKQVISSASLLAEDITEIGTGNLTREVRVKQGGEIGQMAESLSMMVKNLAEMIGIMVSGIQTLKKSSGQLSSISIGMEKVANDTMNRSSTLSTASEEMSTNMNAIAERVANMQVITSGAEQMGLTVREISERSEEAKMVVNDAVANSQKASAKIQELGHAADEISNVTEVITAISERKLRKKSPGFRILPAKPSRKFLMSPVLLQI